MAGVPFSFSSKSGIKVAYLCHESEWVPDNKRIACVLCTSNFNLINRKHHCRVCGEIICGGCSRNIALHGSNRVRACKECIHKSSVAFASDPATLNNGSRFILQTTAHPLFKDLESSPSLWSRFQIGVYLACFIVLVHVMWNREQEFLPSLLAQLWRPK